MARCAKDAAGGDSSTEKRAGLGGCLKSLSRLPSHRGGTTRGSTRHTPDPCSAAPPSRGALRRLAPAAASHLDLRPSADQ